MADPVRGWSAKRGAVTANAEIVMGDRRWIIRDVEMTVATTFTTVILWLLKICWPR